MDSIRYISWRIASFLLFNFFFCLILLEIELNSAFILDHGLINLDDQSEILV